MKYREALCEAMNYLGRDERTLFIGQAVGFPGTAITSTLSGVPHEKLIEFPVAEEMQAGVCLGLALAGYVPICIFPRFNFLILAANQIVNHLDKLPLISDYRPKVIIRVGIGSRNPLDPGPQHDSDFSEAFRLMLKTVTVRRLCRAEDVLPAYQEALERNDSTVLVEVSDLYNA